MMNIFRIILIIIKLLEKEKFKISKVFNNRILNLNFKNLIDVNQMLSLIIGYNNIKLKIFEIILFIKYIFYINSIYKISFFILDKII